MTLTTPDVSTPSGIIRLANTFCDAKALLTAVEFGLFTFLHEHGPATEAEVGARFALHGRGLRDFLDLLTALGLLDRDGGNYRNAEGPDRYLVAGQTEYVGDSWSAPTATSTRPGASSARPCAPASSSPAATSTSSRRTRTSCGSSWG